MSKYRFKTKEEFIKDNLWNLLSNTPTHWASSESMNEYLGTDIPDRFIDNIENNESFHIQSWTFRANNCILKKSATKFIKGDLVKVISTYASDKEWKAIGKISVNFNVGDIFTVFDNIDFSLRIKEFGPWYPISMFEKYDKPIKEYTVKDFVKGQSVIVIATEASQIHWQAVGKVKFPFNIGDILKIKSVTKGLSFECNSTWSYPACMFQPISDVKNTLDDAISAPESLVGKYIKVVKKTHREELPIDFVGKISREETSYIYIEGLTTCISKDRIKEGELIISNYPFYFYPISADKSTADLLTSKEPIIISYNPCSEIEMPMTESFESYLSSSKKTIPNPREIILIKPISIKKRLKI